ncbi:3'-5' exonuclease [Corynebacterium diphtheriae]|uniref:exonuclease domain-containing protein n=2 Tax=Corynebacterium diphtheriae TaxID=1717 RepID=UPI000EF290C2|nr:exonuclease domain-containing protein [Corynebacterium diphtheriae]MBG9256185.1 3'-5' exonuclease [Corynebacterium diphtheriae bv. mitis]MBG9290588.1 3'-5' exonuclease [Corynebacterium diphtheriae bv. gravis]MBG9336031.1 3'-5' exonuclease [Corynebacterium diphtheriae bv. gravis]RLP17776.1 3'-5' exonuclease [Corynebacterium diphtheriae]CAB0582119.1 3'-5' exonuclease [Corynebacterium diphtheriae]
MSVWASRLKAMGLLENLLNRYTPRTSGTPVFAVIDTGTTGFNKRYVHIIELAAVRADAYFKPVDSWHALLNPDTNAVSTTRGTPPPTSALNPAVGVTRSEAS